jgi:hypothetical protein
MSRQISLRNRTNTLMADALRRAQECLVELDREGCTVHAIVMKGGRPVVLIETPPGQFIGAVRMHTNSQGRREALWMAEVARCRVEWAAPPLKAVQA